MVLGCGTSCVTIVWHLRKGGPVQVHDECGHGNFERASNVADICAERVGGRGQCDRHSRDGAIVNADYPNPAVRALDPKPWPDQKHCREFVILDGTTYLGLFTLLVRHRLIPRGWQAMTGHRG